MSKTTISKEIGFETHQLIFRTWFLVFQLSLTQSLLFDYCQNSCSRSPKSKL